MVSYNLGLTLLGNSGCRSDFFFWRSDAGSITMLSLLDGTT
jgi:hypothetical protein